MIEGSHRIKQFCRGFIVVLYYTLQRLVDGPFLKITLIMYCYHCVFVILVLFKDVMMHVYI